MNKFIYPALIFCLCIMVSFIPLRNKDSRVFVKVPVIEAVEDIYLDITVSNNAEAPDVLTNNDEKDQTVSTEETSEDLSPKVENYIDLSTEERELLARVVFLEAGACSFECQLAVASVVINRLESGRWLWDTDGNKKQTIRDIIYYPNAFSVVKNIPYTTPTELSYMVVDYIIELGPTIPPEVRYFRKGYDFKWNNYKNYCVLDNLYFGYLTNGGW